MDPRQIPGNDMERTHFRGRATIHPLPSLEDHLAHGRLLQLLEGGGDVRAPCLLLFFGELISGDARLQCLYLLKAGCLVSRGDGGFHLGGEASHALSHGRISLMDGIGQRSRISLGYELRLLVTESRNGFLGEGHGSQHVLLRDLIRSSLYHGDVIFGTGDGELQIGGLLLSDGGIDDELPRFTISADAHAGSRAIEGSTSYQERRRGTAHADGIGRVLAIVHERGGHHMHLVLEAIRKPRADGPIYHAGGEGAMIRGLRLPLQISSRNTAHSVHLLHDINGQGEEVVVALLLGHHGGHQDAGLTTGHEHRPCCLLR